MKNNECGQAIAGTGPAGVYTLCDLADAVTVSAIVGFYLTWRDEMGIGHSANAVDGCLNQWPAANFGDGETGAAIREILTAYGKSGLAVYTFGDSDYRPAFVFGYMSKSAQNLRYRTRNSGPAVIAQDA